MSLAATGAQAQETVNICGRTPQVQDVILALTPTNDACGSVLVSEMASFKGIILLNRRDITSLLPGDFSGLDSIIALRLKSNKLMELPLGVFSGLTGLPELSLDNNKLETLPSGIFSGLPNLAGINLDNNRLSELPSGLFSGLSRLVQMSLDNNRLSELPSGLFSGLSRLVQMSLDNNRLSELPSGLFSGLSKLDTLTLHDNPSAPFRFTLKFSSSQLRKNFTTASVRLTLREGAPRPITVPLSATGATLSANSVSFTTGSVRSNAVTVTRVAPGSAFELRQGEPELGGDDDRYTGFEIVPGPSVTTASFTHARVKVFLEGALE